MVKIGEVVVDHDSPSHLWVTIQLLPNKDVAAGQFVEIRDDDAECVYIAQIVKPLVYNPYYKDPRLVQEGLWRGDTRILIPSEPSFNVKIAKARILGSILDNKVEFLGKAPNPGSEVHEINLERLRKFLGLANDDGMYIGHLHYHPDLRVTVDYKHLFYHMAILGTTGSGKSYATGVLIEELVKKGISVVVIDPHGEYSSMRNIIDPRYQDVKLNIQEFSTSLYKIKGTEVLTCKVSELSAEDIIELTNLTGDQQKNLIYHAMRVVKRGNGDYSLSELVHTIESVGKTRGFRKDTIDSVINRIQMLKEYGILGKTGVEPKVLVRPHTLSIINLCGADNILAQRVLVATILRKLFEYRKIGEIEEFIVVIDEAHRYAPSDGETVSKGVINRIVREGRKFGVGVIIVSQSPKDIDPSILKLCNSRLILKLDNPIDINVIKPYTGILSEEILEQLPFYPPGRGILSGLLTRVPIIVNIRKRYTQHGGETLRVIMPKREISKEDVFDDRELDAKVKVTSLMDF